MSKDVADRILDAWALHNKLGLSYPIEVYLSKADWKELVNYLNNKLRLPERVSHEWRPGQKFFGLHVLIGDSQEIVFE